MSKTSPQLLCNHIDANSLDLKSLVLRLIQKYGGRACSRNGRSLVPWGPVGSGALGSGGGLIEAAEQFARVLDIGGDLLAQFLGTVEFSLVAQALPEAYF